MKNVKEGQMGMLIWRESDGYATWCYCVAKNIFDDRIEFLRDGFEGSYVHVIDSVESESIIIDNQKTTPLLIMLNRDGKPVQSKKTIFGKYTFEPKK